MFSLLLVDPWNWYYFLSRSFGFLSILVSCLAGKYFDVRQKKCLNCPRGSYTENPGRLGCTKCPPGKITFATSTSNATHCKSKYTFLY